MLKLLSRENSPRFHLIPSALRRPNIAAVDTLSIPAFRYLWGSSGLTKMAGQIRVLTVAWLVLDLTDSQLWVGLVNGLPAVAIAALSVLGGVLVDRTNPRAMLLRTRLTMAVSAFLAAFLVTAGMIEVWHLIVLSFLLAGGNGMDLVAEQKWIGALVSKERLLNALSLSKAATNIAQIAGPALGGIILAWLGASAALWALAAAFGLALAALARFPGNTTAQKRITNSAMRDLSEGFRYVGRTQHVRWLVILGGVAVLPYCFIPLMPAHVRDTLNAGPDKLGFLLGCYGLGGLAGSLFLTLLNDVSRKGLAMVGAALGLSLALVGLAFSHSFYVSAGCMVVIGVMWVVWQNNVNTMFQTTVPPEMQGRVIGINKILYQGQLSWLVVGLLAAAFGQFATFLIGGAVFTLANLIAYCRTPELRHPD